VIAGARLAGSTLTMDRAVATAAQLLDVPLPHAVRMATEVPARILGREHELGALAPGRAADLVALDADGRAHATMIGGQW
jgi:N-acetylglucosamine-6-phosphate deacetylase